MRLFKKNILSLAHLPTWMLIIGLPLYWLEMLFHNNNYGMTTPLAWILFLVVAVIVLRNRVHLVERFWPENNFARILIFCGLAFCLVMAAVYCYAAFLPPHLPQEEDVLNYHYTFPRQHLIRNSFKYIPWSTFDLFPYPVQFGLASFWFATELPNKLPQLVFFMAVPFLMVRLLKILGKDDPLKFFLVFFAFWGAHHTVIQGGTAMLDIVLAYLFLAGLDSLLRGNWIFAAVEFVFYFWAKSFLPLQTIAVIAALMVIIVILKRLHFTINWGFFSLGKMLKLNNQMLGKFALLFAVLSVFVAGPFIVKALKVGGTPLFPFFVGAVPHFQNAEEQLWEWDSFVAAAKYDLSMKDAYGLSRTPLNLIKHFWLVAVPQEGVNNVFDYPIGLVYLLCIGPFIYLMIKQFKIKQVGIIPLLICLIWASWWLGSQQSRFLYVPLFLMYVLVIADIRPSRMFLVGMVFAVFLSAGSAFRAHQADFGKSPEVLLRSRDKKFRQISYDYVAKKKSEIMIVDDYQAAYAQFPARVLEENFPYTLRIKNFK